MTPRRPELLNTRIVDDAVKVVQRKRVVQRISKHDNAGQHDQQAGKKRGAQQGSLRPFLRHDGLAQRTFTSTRMTPLPLPSNSWSALPSTAPIIRLWSVPRMACPAVGAVTSRSPRRIGPFSPVTLVGITPITPSGTVSSRFTSTP